MKKIVGNGQDTLFWLDNWYNDSALLVQFSILFSKAKVVDSLTLAQVWNCSNAKISLTKGASLELRKENGEFLAFLTSLQLDSSISDTVFWGLLSTGIFTVHSMYLFLNFRGIRTSLVGSVWKLSISLKIKIFIWLALQVKILTRDVLLRRG
jgi:zinc-binding in reverse transcriptase